MLDAVADRYSFHLILAWFAIVISLAVDRAWRWRSLGGGLLIVSLLFALPGDWALAPIPPTNFQVKARLFAKAPPGTAMEFPTRPFFAMKLTKK